MPVSLDESLKPPLASLEFFIIGKADGHLLNLLPSDKKGLILLCVLYPLDKFFLHL
jgi:hypothetical protein